VKSRRTPTFFWLALLVVAAYALPLFGGATFVGRDHMTMTLPSMGHLAQALRSGHLPQWWDAIDLGGAFLANPNHAALYPPAWLVAVLPMPWGADFVIALHVLFAGIGVAELARRFGAGRAGQVTAGGAFMLSGFVTSFVVYGVPLIALSWLPWIAVAADRVACAKQRGESARAALWLAAAMAAGLFAGDAAYVIQGGLLALGLALCRAEKKLVAVAWCAGASLAAVVLAAIVIVPALMLVGETLRSELTTSATAQVWSLHPWRVLEWIWPDALGDPNQSNLYLARAIADTGSRELGPALTLSAYVGLPVVALAIVGWLHCAKRLAFVALAFVVLALGSFTPAYRLYRAVFLPEQLVRYPEKYLAGALVLACAAAGVGLGKLAAREVSKRTWIVLGACVAALGVLVAVVMVAGEAIISDNASLDRAATASHIAHWGAVALAAAAITGAALWLVQRQIGALVVAVIAIVAPLVAGVWHWLPLVSRERVTAAPALLPGDGEHDGMPTRLHRPLDLDSGGATIEQQALHMHETAMPDIGARFGYASVPSYDQAHWTRTRRAFNALERRVALSIYGVELAYLPEQIAVHDHMTPILRGGGGLVLARLASARPRAFVASGWTWAAEPDLLRTLAAAHAGPPNLDIVLTGEGVPGKGDGEHVCQVIAPYAERVELQCHAPAASYAVLLDSWAPGWTATVDGDAAEILIADGVVRAVAIAAGDHSIVFSYRTPGLVLGALVSLAGWLAWGAAFFVLRRRAKITT